MKKLLSVQEVANIFGVSTVTIQTYCRNGILPATELEGLWRVDEDDLKQFIMERKSSFLKKDPLYGVPLSDEEQQIINEKINAAETLTEKIEIFASVAHRKIQKVGAIPSGGKNIILDETVYDGEGNIQKVGGKPFHKTEKNTKSTKKIKKNRTDRG